MPASAPSPVAFASFVPRYKTLVDIYDHATKTHADRELFGTKVQGRWTWTTYREFASLVERLRGGLASLGLTRGDVLAIVSNNRVEWAVAAYACYGLGVAYVPMYEAQSPKEWELIVRDCEAKVLIVGTDAVSAKAEPLLDSCPSLRHIVRLEGAAPAGSRITTYGALLDSGRRQDAIVPAPGDTAALIYTSGTTGKPKGVVLTHLNVAANVSAVADVFPLRAEDRSLSFLPWAHCFGQIVELHVLFSAGASMAIAEGTDKIISGLAEVQPTLLFSVPRIFNKLYTAVQAQIATKPRALQRAVKAALEVTAKERAGQRLKLSELALLEVVDKLVFEKVRARFGGRLTYAISGGAALSREVAEFIDSLGIMVYEGYGLTETSPIATANVPGARRIGSVGRPIPGVRVEIDTAHGVRGGASRDADRSDPSRAMGGGGGASGGPARIEGEIVVYGHNVMKGYFRRPEENAAVFTQDGGLRTGDMGFVDPQGFVFVTGRVKEQYKLENGKYVVPTPLEEQIKLSPFVANAMVYGDNRPYNVALVVAALPAVRAWAAEQHHLTLPSEDAAALRHERVRELYQKEIAKYGAAFKGFESIQDFALLTEDFTAENGMLTPSLKLKRRNVVERYATVLEGLYAKGEPAARSKRRAASA